MAETDSNDIYVKPLYVFAKTNTSLVKRTSPCGGDEIPAIDFYPEGGTIMTGINSTVALIARLNNQPYRRRLYKR
jgi:hypothetical protein